MPAKSKSQYRFFQAMKHDPKLAEEKGISPKVAEEFTEGMTKKRFGNLKEKLKRNK